MRRPIGAVLRLESRFFHDPCQASSYKVAFATPHGRGGGRPPVAQNSPTPVVLRYKGFRFFFYSNEGNPREPVHVHGRAGSGEAKLWLAEQVRVAMSWGFDAGTLRELVSAAQANRETIERAWHDYFGQGGAFRR